MTDESAMGFYWRGFYSLILRDPLYYARLVKEGEFTALGRNPTCETFMRLVKLGSLGIDGKEGETMGEIGRATFGRIEEMIAGARPFDPNEEEQRELDDFYRFLSNQRPEKNDSRKKE